MYALTGCNFLTILKIPAPQECGKEMAMSQARGYDIPNNYSSQYLHIIR